LVNVSDRVWLLPTGTLPKLRLAGLALSFPCATPVPDTATVSVGSDALLLTVTLPLEVPAACGVNVTLNVALCPLVSVSGKPKPLILKSLPATVACVTVTLPALLFVILSARVLLWPAITVPKSRLGLLMERVADSVVGATVLRP